MVEAVGLGETTITAKAKLKGSNHMHTATCRVIVTGFIAESKKINGGESTVKGTFYGKNGKKVVDGNLSEVGIGDVIDIVQDSSSGTPKDIVSIKDTVIAKNIGSLKVNSKLTVNAGGTLTVQDDKPVWSMLRVYDTLDIYGTVNISSGCYIGGYIEMGEPDIVNIYGILNIQGGNIESLSKLTVQSGGIVNFQSPGLYSATGIIIRSGSIVNLQNTTGYTCIINVNSSGVVNVQKGGTIFIEKLNKNVT